MLSVTFFFLFWFPEVSEKEVFLYFVLKRDLDKDNTYTI